MKKTDRVYLREWRLAKGLTQPELAKRVGTVKSEISRLEKGSRRMTLDWMSKIAKCLGISVDDLMSLPPMGFGAVSPAPDSGDAQGTDFEKASVGDLTVGVKSGHHLFQTVTGDEWLGVFSPGDLLIYDISKHSVAVPGIFVIEAEGERMTRRVSGQTMTCPNEQYPPMQLAEEHRVLGRVVGHFRRI